MDTRPDGNENLTVNGCPVPEPDYEDGSTIPLGDDKTPFNVGADAGKQGEDQYSKEGSCKDAGS